MNDLQCMGRHRGFVGYAWALTLLMCSFYGQHDVYGQQTQTINAHLAGQADKWDETPQNGIPCMQTYAPYAALVFDVVVPEPGAVYKVSLDLVKVTNGGYLKVFIDDELQTEVDTLVSTNTRETILVCERFIAPGKHTLKVKNFGQKTSVGGNHLSVVGFEIVCPQGSGQWQVEEKVFSFTPIRQADASRQANLFSIGLPPRLQDEPFSIPPESDAATVFSHPWVMANKIPFQIPDVKDVPETGRLLEEQKPLEIDLPGSAREIFLLIWSKIPPVDHDGGPGKPSIGPIDQSERFTAEIVYGDGDSEHFIPRNVTTKSYGLDNGLSLYVLHPIADGMPERLILHDKVYKCSFAVVAVTCNSDDLIFPEPSVRETCAWYPSTDRKFPAVTRLVQSKVHADHASISDGIIDAQVGVQDGLRWNRLGSPVYGEVILDKSPVFAVRQTDRWIGSDQWKVVETKDLDNGDPGILIRLDYQKQATHLQASVTMALSGAGQLKMGLTLVNASDQPFLGRTRFPILEGLKLGRLDDTWYYFPESNGASMIHHTEGNVYGSHGASHPLQVDSFFNPEKGYALTLLGNDLQGQFHWFDVGKGEEGGWYRQEYLEKRLKPGATWSFPECLISISPGDWRTSFRLYQDWVKTWYQPKPAAQDWYKRSFVTGALYVYSGLERLVTATGKVRDLMGYCDVVSLAGWHGREHPENPTHHPDHEGDHIHEYSGEYDRNALFPVGGIDRFKSVIDQAAAAGIPISPYTNPILINENAYHVGAKRHEWGFGYRPVDYGNMMGYVPCLSIGEWLDYMVESEKFLAQDLGAKVIYLDQLGAGNSICHRKDHAHQSPEPHFYGERELTRRIRAAIPEDAAICSESHPEDTRLQFQNGMYQGGVLRHLTRQIRVPLNMTRFAFPDVKCFNNIYNHVLKDNNWKQLKFVLFNGDGFFMPRAYDPTSYFGKKAIREHKKVFRILHENVDAFTSSDVEPLIPTLIPGTFVNRFGRDEKIIWTVFNANYRTVKGRLIEIAVKPAAEYTDLWKGALVTTSIHGSTASLVVEIGPRDVACISEIAK